MVSVAVPGDGAKVAAGTFDRTRVVHLTGASRSIAIPCHTAPEKLKMGYSAADADWRGRRTASIFSAWTPWRGSSISNRRTRARQLDGASVAWCVKTGESAMPSEGRPVGQPGIAGIFEVRSARPDASGMTLLRTTLPSVSGITAVV